MTEDKEKRPFRASDWLPTDNGQVVSCNGNCVEIGLGLTLEQVDALFYGLAASGENLGVCVWVESDDGVLRVFLRVGFGRGLRVFDDLKAECLWRLALSEVHVALAWNAMAAKFYEDAVRDEETQNFSYVENRRLFNLLDTIGGPI